jgi:hypothetical protein
MAKLMYAILDTKNIKCNGDKTAELFPEWLMNFTAGSHGVSVPDLKAVAYKDISAVLSDIEGKSIVTDNTSALCYADVIDELFQRYTLLPVRFGSVMESTGAVKKLLERNYDEIKQNLCIVENKYEFGLKVYCDTEYSNAELTRALRAKEEPESGEKPGQNISADVNASSVFKDYLMEKLKVYKSEELLTMYIDNIIEEITRHLVPLNPVHTQYLKFKKIVSGIKKSSAIIDGVFLLDKEQYLKKKSDLIHTVEDLKSRFTISAPCGLDFVLTGPWPPYNFVNITLK